jgi:hypothetical protein
MGAASGFIQQVRVSGLADFNRMNMRNKPSKILPKTRPFSSTTSIVVSKTKLPTRGLCMHSAFMSM